MEATIVRVPKLYENMDEATIGEWLAAEGSEVAEGAPLVELVTDKTVHELTAPVAGIVRRHFAAARSVLPVTAALAAIGGPADADWSPIEAANDALRTDSLMAMGVCAPTPPQAPPAAARARIAPAARAFAKQHQIDLDAVAAALGDRVIHRRDLEEWLAATGSNDSVAVAPTPAAVPLDANSPAAEPRVALITGASGAIGTAIARRLAADGCRIAIHYHTGTDAANELVRSLRSAGVEAAAFQADLANTKAATALAEAVIARFGRIDILINNAGLLDDAVIAFMQDEQWHRVMNANLNSAFYLTRAVAMPMARNRGGRIVNIASDAGRLGAAGRANYAAAKAGVVGLTKSAARELAASNIQVNAISPGFVDSAMTAGIAEPKRKELLKLIPARRFGTPEEIAELAAYLCSPLAAYVTGQEISIDGGLYIG